MAILKAKISWIWLLPPIIALLLIWEVGYINRHETVGTLMKLGMYANVAQTHDDRFCYLAKTPEAAVEFFQQSRERRFNNRDQRITAQAMIGTDVSLERKQTVIDQGTHYEVVYAVIRRGAPEYGEGNGWVLPEYLLRRLPVPDQAEELRQATPVTTAAQ